MRSPPRSSGSTRSRPKSWDVSPTPPRRRCATRVQREIWGEDVDTWVASPYAPFGRAREVDGGYRFSGRWAFSTGTDHSKDVSIDDAFVPGYRVAVQSDFQNGIHADANGREGALYQLPFNSVFPAAINAATLGICDGALAAFLDDWRRLYDIAESGKHPTDAQRLALRADGVRAVRRAVDAVDRLFMIAGGTSLHRGHPLQRFWRDAHAAMNHICNVADPMYTGWSNQQFGLEYDAMV